MAARGAAAPPQLPRGSPASGRLDEYRRLADTTLAPLVDAKAAELARVQEELEEWEGLAVQLRLLAAHAEAHPPGGGEGAAGAPFKMLADVGAGFRMHARVAPGDAGTVYLHVGAGVYPALSLPEARAYAGAKVDALGRMEREAREALVGVRTDLAVARAAIAALAAGEGGEDDGEGGEQG